eukprot:ANDGO_06566.mRNA.1 hypothetical protein
MKWNQWKKISPVRSLCFFVAAFIPSIATLTYILRLLQMPRYEPGEINHPSATLTPHGSRSPRQPMHISHMSLGDHSIDQDAPSLFPESFMTEKHSLFDDGEGGLQGPLLSRLGSNPSEQDVGATAAEDAAKQSLLAGALHIVLRHPDMVSMYTNLIALGRLTGCNIEFEETCANRPAVDSNPQGPGAVLDSHCAPLPDIIESIPRDVAVAQSREKPSSSRVVQRCHSQFGLSSTDLRSGHVVLKAWPGLPCEALVPLIVLEFLNLSDKYGELGEINESHRSSSKACETCTKRIQRLILCQEKTVDSIIHDGIQQYEWPSKIAIYSFSSLRQRNLLSQFLQEYAEHCCQCLDRSELNFARPFETPHRSMEAIGKW